MSWKSEHSDTPRRARLTFLTFYSYTYTQCICRQTPAHSVATVVLFSVVSVYGCLGASAGAYHVDPCLLLCL